MSEISIGFEMTDALIAQAVREDCIAVAREHIALKDILIIFASTLVFALVLRRESHWLWWLAGLPAVGFALLGIGWVLSYLWLPRVAKSKLARLPNRRVQVEASEAALSFQNAAERLEVAWTELKAFERRPSFWIVCLWSGIRIPIPAELITLEAASTFKARVAASVST